MQLMKYTRSEAVLRVRCLLTSEFHSRMCRVNVSTTHYKEVLEFLLKYLSHYKYHT